MSGLTVAVVAVPQSMAYALIAGLPVQYGLYASIVPTIVACLWGSSAHLVTGPTTAVSLVVFTSLAELAPAGTPHYLELAFLLAFIVGAIQLGMGLARIHRTETWRGVMAVLSPVLLCCGCYLAFVIAAIGMPALFK